MSGRGIVLWHGAEPWPFSCQRSFGIDFRGSRTSPTWQLLQRFGAHVHLSQGKQSPQVREMSLCKPDLGLLGDAKGRTQGDRWAARMGLY